MYERKAAPLPQALCFVNISIQLEQLLAQSPMHISDVYIHAIDMQESRANAGESGENEQTIYAPALCICTGRSCGCTAATRQLLTRILPTCRPLEHVQEGQPTAEVTFAVREAGGSRSAAVLRLRHSLDADCGGHRLALGCALWVYNQTGLPIALQMAGRSDEEVSADKYNKVQTPYNDCCMMCARCSPLSASSCPKLCATKIVCLRRCIRACCGCAAGRR